MKRSSPLRVEQLEDRCVPATGLLSTTTTTTLVAAPTTSYVIDPILIDPNAPAPAPAPSSSGSISPLLIPPIASPFWY